MKIKQLNIEVYNNSDGIYTNNSSNIEVDE